MRKDSSEFDFSLCRRHSFQYNANSLEFGCTPKLMGWGSYPLPQDTHQHLFRPFHFQEVFQSCPIVDPWCHRFQKRQVTRAVADGYGQNKSTALAKSMECNRPPLRCCLHFHQENFRLEWQSNSYAGHSYDDFAFSKKYIYRRFHFRQFSLTSRVY
jgi:hypothetical protein